MSERDTTEPDSSPSDLIPLGNASQISLGGLTEAQKQQIRMQYAEKMVSLNMKAQELGIEAQALDAHLRNMGAAAVDATRNDIAVTMTRTTNDSLGRTEIIMGNTETAAKGKLSRSQEGQRDLTLVYVVVAAIVVILVAVIINK